MYVYSAPRAQKSGMSLRFQGAGVFALVLLSSFCSIQASDLHQGCYNNYELGIRPLRFQAASTSTMTPALCSTMAKTRFATAYGVEYGRECWLDPEHSSLSKLTRCGPSDRCDYPCAGDPSSTCGGDFAVNLYTSNPREWNLTFPESGFEDLGCYRDSQDFRDMHKLLWVSSTAMSAELCAHIAFAEHWPIFGLQYGIECWGSDDMARAQNLGRSGVCNMTCPGNSSQTCGGAWGMQVYRFNTRPADDGTHAGTTPAEPEPTTNAGTQVTQETSSGSSGGPSQLVDGSNSNTAAAAAGVATSQEYSAAGQTGAAVVMSLLLAGTGYLATSLLT